MKMSIIDFYCLMVSDFFVVVPICRCPFWLHRHGGGKRRSPARTAAGTASSCELGQGSLEIMSCRCTSLSLLYGLSGVRAINIVLSEFMAVCGAVFFCCRGERGMYCYAHSPLGNFFFCSRSIWLMLLSGVGRFSGMVTPTSLMVSRTFLPTA